MARILIDSGFWLGLCDPQDQWHGAAKTVAQELFIYQWLLPWPTFYEILATRFVKKPRQVESFLAELKRIKHDKIDDTRYRETALQMAFSMWQGRNLSLVDLVLRQMLMDKTLRVNSIITFNHRDFSDICHRQGIQCYPDPN